MWIRSQDKINLINTDRIDVEGKTIYAYQPIHDGYVNIGEYKTHEKALKILDNIESAIVTYETNKILATAGADIIRDLYPVFQMPIEVEKNKK